MREKVWVARFDARPGMVRIGTSIGRTFGRDMIEEFAGAKMVDGVLFHLSDEAASFGHLMGAVRQIFGISSDRREARQVWVKSTVEKAAVEIRLLLQRSDMPYEEEMIREIEESV